MMFWRPWQTLRIEPVMNRRRMSRNIGKPPPGSAFKTIVIGYGIHMMRSYFVGRIKGFVFLVEIHVIGYVFNNHLVVVVNEMFLRFRDIALSMLRGSNVVIGMIFIVGN